MSNHQGSVEGHTAGPWSLVEGHNNRLVMGTDGETVAEVHWWIAAHAAESLANARLIAAAPELYEACKVLDEWGPRLMVQFDGHPDDHAILAKAVKLARAALSKATPNE